MMAAMVALFTLLSACGTTHVKAEAPAPPQSIPTRHTEAPKPACQGPPRMKEPNPRWNGTKVGVLMFHDVAPNPKHNPYIVTPQVLEWDFNYLANHNYHPITLHTFHEFLLHHWKVPTKAVLLTFDDGYQGIYHYALPLTERYHFPAVLFMITGFLSRYPDVHQVYSPYITTPEAEGMLKSGLWNVEGHTYAGHWNVQTVKGGHKTTGHFLMTRKWLPVYGRLETKTEYEARLWGDILLMTHELRKIGVCRPEDFAFPFGQHNPTLDKLLNQAGYRFLYGGNHWAVDTYRVSLDDIHRIDTGNTKKQFLTAIHVAYAN